MKRLLVAALLLVAGFMFSGNVCANSLDGRWNLQANGTATGYIEINGESGSIQVGSSIIDTISNIQLSGDGSLGQRTITFSRTGQYNQKFTGWVSYDKCQMVGYYIHNGEEFPWDAHNTTCSDASGNDRYDDGMDAGKQLYKDNPAACDIEIGSGYDEGYTAGFAAGKDDCPDGPTTPGTCEAVTLSAGLKFHIPEATYTPFGGEPMELWADLEFYSDENGTFLWKLGEYGSK